MCPHCQRLPTRGELPFGSDLHCSNSSLKPQDSERDATQYLEQASDCQELKAAIADSPETRAENTALWWSDLASHPLPGLPWMWRLKLEPFPSIQHL